MSRWKSKTAKDGYGSSRLLALIVLTLYDMPLTDIRMVLPGDATHIAQPGYSDTMTHNVSSRHPYPSHTASASYQWTGSEGPSERGH